MSAETSKTHLLQILVGTVLSYISLTALIVYTDPYSATLTTHLFFYLSFFFAIAGTFTTLGMYARRVFSKGLYVQSFWISFRQGVLIGVLACASLLLQSQGLLVWWVFGGLVLFLTFVELFFIS